jgi:LCP family protein required for cell wall assembly
MKMSVNVKKVLIAIGFLLIFLVSFVGGVFAQKVIMPQGEGVDLADLVSSAAERFSSLTGSKGDQVWLIAGLDTVGEMKGAGSEGHNDTLILAFVHGSTINLLYIPRDSLVDIPGKGVTKVGHTFLYGGVRKLAETIKQNFGVAVDHYVVVNFSTVIEMVDLMGGLKVDVPQRYCYQGVGVPKYTCIDKGTQTLNGTEFLVYWRIRDYGRTRVSDLTRIQRQIDLLLETDLKDQVISKLSPSFVSSAVDVWSKYVLSDVSLMEIASLANKWKDAHIEADVLSGDSFISRVFDLGVPVSVYQWDAEWLKSWYVEKFGPMGQTLANGVNPPKLSTNRSTDSSSSKETLGNNSSSSSSEGKTSTASNSGSNGTGSAGGAPQPTPTSTSTSVITTTTTTSTTTQNSSASNATTNVNDTATESVPELPPELENNTTVATGAVNDEIPGPVITPTTATPPEENYDDSWDGSDYDSKNNETETFTVTNVYTETPTEGGH